MKNLTINSACTVALIAMLAFANFACGYANERAWKANPAQARIDCHRGAVSACTWLSDNGLFTEQYAHSGSGKVTTSGPRY